MVSSVVRADDVRLLLQLAGEAHDLTVVGRSPTLHVLRGLAQTIGADIGVDGKCLVRPKTPLKMRSVTDFGWRSAAERQHVYEFLCTQTPESDPLTVHTTKPLSERAPVGTRSRFELCDETAWSNTATFAECERSAGVHDSLMCAVRLPDGWIRALVFKRGRGTRFAQRERDLVQLFVSSTLWIFRRPIDPTATTEQVPLSPRERETLSLLLTGQPEKQLADSLGVSRHTAHEYVKIVYRKLGVSSRAELMARALSGSELGGETSN